MLFFIRKVSCCTSYWKYFSYYMYMINDITNMMNEMFINLSSYY